MPRSFDQIVHELGMLGAEDFDYGEPGSNGMERLHELTDELLLLPQPEKGIRALFDVIERMPETDLGSPGPIVHTLERLLGHYENELADSIRRRPAFLSVWMVNRILNGARTSEQKAYYMDLLRVAAEHPSAPESARREANDFIRYQRKA